jgi:hypothetical protein
MGWTAGYVPAPRWIATGRPYQPFVFLVEEFTRLEQPIEIGRDVTYAGHGVIGGAHGHDSW